MINPVTKAKYSVSPKGIFIKKGQRTSTGHHQRDRHHNDDFDMPKDAKEITDKTRKHNPPEIGPQKNPIYPAFKPAKDT